MIEASKLLFSEYELKRSFQLSQRLVVFKGGSAFNSLIETFHQFFPNTSYVVPISDDGGSSREICRVFGGPSIGDLRSTLTRLSDHATPESFAVKRLLDYRLSNHDGQRATSEWHQLLEDKHPLYEHISSQYRGLIRCFLCKFEAERLQRISHAFDLKNGSIGNFFFTGSRIVLGSLETAIFVYSSVARMNCVTRVLPVIDSSDRLTIAARLDDDEVIMGQDAISHPSGNAAVNKSDCLSLPSPIRQLFYIDKYGNLIHPLVNHNVIEEIKRCHRVIYGIGSFWTSIAPSLILDGVGEAIAQQNCSKIMLLNSCNDRETAGMTAYDYVIKLTEILNRFGKLNYVPKDFITDFVVTENSQIKVAEEHIKDLGIKIHKIPHDSTYFFDLNGNKYPTYCAKNLVKLLKLI